MSPTQRSLALLRKDGWFVEVTEHWNPYVHKRNDLFGFGDILGMNGDNLLIVQTTSADHVSDRLHKIRNIQASSLWLEAPTRNIHVHGWGKYKVKRGGKAMRWKCRVINVRTGEETILSP